MSTTTNRPVSQSEEFELDIPNPEYVLLLVLGLLLWIFAFVDLLVTTNAEIEGVVFNTYPVPHFVYIVLLGVGFIGWVTLLIPRNTQRLKDGVAWLQQRPLPWFLAIGLLAFTLFVVSEHDQIAYFGVLQTSFVVLILLALLVLLLANWRSSIQTQHWRWLIAGPTAGLLLIESVLQIVAYGGFLPLPVQHFDGMFVPYGRIYQNVQGETNGRSNQYGWYYPDFRLEEGSHRIALIGDNFIQAVEVQPEQHLGLALESELARDAAQPIEVMGLGMASLGPGQYLETLKYSQDVFGINEAILFINLGNDFQSPAKDPGRYIFYAENEDGVFDVARNGSRGSWHAALHLIYRTQQQYRAWQTVKSYFLLGPLAIDTARSVRDMLGRGPNLEKLAPVTQDLDLVNWQNDGRILSEQRHLWTPSHYNDWDLRYHILPATTYVFTQDRSNDVYNGLETTPRIIELARQFAAENGIDLKIVTIPVFPQAFYDQYSGTEWSPELGEYDLFLPEEVLVEYATAHDVPILATGQLLQNRGMSVETIQSLYFNQGKGYFTPAGHDFLAQAIDDCFYAGQTDTVCNGQ